MITERILKYLDFRGITKYKFCKDLGLSNGFLDKPREISTDKYANILVYFPELNPDWLLTGVGPMEKTKYTQTHAHSEKTEAKNIDIQSKDNNNNNNDIIKYFAERIEKLSAENALLKKGIEDLSHQNKAKKFDSALMEVQL
jgi:hypothetical protein